MCAVREQVLLCSGGWGQHVLPHEGIQSCQAVPCTLPHTTGVHGQLAGSRRPAPAAAPGRGPRRSPGPRSPPLHPPPARPRTPGLEKLAPRRQARPPPLQAPATAPASRRPGHRCRSPASALAAPRPRAGSRTDSATVPRLRPVGGCQSGCVPLSDASLGSPTTPPATPTTPSRIPDSTPTACPPPTNCCARPGARAMNTPADHRRPGGRPAHTTLRRGLVAEPGFRPAGSVHENGSRLSTASQVTASPCRLINLDEFGSHRAPASEPSMTKWPWQLNGSRGQPLAERAMDRITDTTLRAPELEPARRPSSRAVVTGSGDIATQHTTKTGCRKRERQWPSKWSTRRRGTWKLVRPGGRYPPNRPGSGIPQASIRGRVPGPGPKGSAGSPARLLAGPLRRAMGL